MSILDIFPPILGNVCCHLPTKIPYSAALTCVKHLTFPCILSVASIITLINRQVRNNFDLREKTHLLHFHNGQPLQIVKNLRYLGTDFGDLSGTAHCSNRNTASTRAFYILMRAGIKYPELDSNIVVNIFKVQCRVSHSLVVIQYFISTDPGSSPGGDACFSH